MALIVAPFAGRAACVIHTLAELPVTMQGTQPLIEAKVNGAPALFLADSGASYSFISPGSAAEFHLRLAPAPFNVQARGIGGSVDLSVATVKDFVLARLPIPGAQFLVGGSESAALAKGVIGRNILGLADVEYDLAGGMIRLMRTDHCGGEPLAYWAKPPLTYSAIDIGESQGTPFRPDTVGTASVNGTRIKVIFDTGASMSVMTLDAAKRLGLAPGGPGVIPAGFVYGAGPHRVTTWIAPVDVFELGDEKIEHTRLRFGDITPGDADLRLGADFFLSHRVLVANSQHKLYFTYNGGPVFNLAVTHDAAASQAPVAAPPGGGAEPVDAEAFARRGAAFAARRDFAPAIADLTKAIELDPKADYSFQRAVVRLQAGQPVLAMGDLDRTLAIAPGHPRALISRAALRDAAHDHPGALADLDAADKVLPAEDNERLVMARLYRSADAPARALTQYDLWIKVHPVDHNQGEALAGRCWVRLLLGTDLDKAMADCQRALHLLPNDWGALDGRAFVRLRQGDLDKAIADFDETLKLQTRNAWPYYGRGLAKLKKGLIDPGKADIAAAVALNPNIAKDAGRYGFAP